MKILVTGAKGMVGTALVNNLKNVKEGKNKNRTITIDEIYEYDINNTIFELELYCQECDFIFHLAGVNRPQNQEEFMQGNYDFSFTLLNLLKKHNNKCPIMLSSSIQASLNGIFKDSKYGESKKAGENLFLSYAKENDVDVYIYRFPNLMGHSKPNYNSAISTFCWAIANDQEYTVNDQNTEIELLYIDDLVQGMFYLLEGKALRCEYDGVEIIENKNGRFCYINNTHKVKLGYIIDLLKEFKKQNETLLMPKMADGSFEKKLYALYLTYLPKEKIKYKLKMNVDNRGSFTELYKTKKHGQVSVNIIKPGITKGQHWHNSKWEIFIVVHGEALIQERNINTNELIEFKVSGEKIEAIYMIPGWTHNIINVSQNKDLVTVMICNEVFDPNNPDTYYQEV